MNLNWSPARVPWFVLCLWIFALLSSSVGGQTNSVAERSSAGAKETAPIYNIEKFALEYGPKGSQPHPDLPPVADLLRVKIELGRREDVYVAATNAHALVV